MNFNAPGTSGPAEVPEYAGKTVGELVAAKMRDPTFLRSFAATVADDVFAHLAAGDDVTFLARLKHELRVQAEEDAALDVAEARKAFYEAVVNRRRAA